MTSSRWQRFKEWLGPYDYNYSFIFAAVIALYSAQSRVISYSMTAGLVRTHFILISLSENLLLAIFVTAIFRILHLTRRGRAVSLARYLIELVIGMLGVSLAIAISNAHKPEPLIRAWGPNDTPALFATRLLFTVLFVALTHRNLRSLKARLKTVNDLNESLEGKYRTLVESDEEIRDQAARYIHDRVQAEITLVNVKLQKVGALHGAEVQESLHPAISRLEKIRAIDLKLVSQILTPNLEAEGLKGAIETLCEQYQSGVEYQILIDVDVNECGEELTLGIYRIIEQGIINAITHGPASKVMIRIQKSDSDTYLLEISDNGPGAYNPKPGTGSVIIDAWCSILDGVKEIESEVDRGYTLRVRIPAKR